MCRYRLILSCVGLFLLATQLSPVQRSRGDDATAKRRPNILFVIADDQSWPHASAYGCAAVQTPHFDRVAREGVLFNNAFAPTPGCSPTRAAILTGRHHW